MTAPHTVTCLPRGREFPARSDETLLEAARRADVPLAASCGGRAVCGDCLVRVLDGARTLTPAGADELAWRRRTGIRTPGRLACAARPAGPVSLTTTYW